MKSIEIVSNHISDSIKKALLGESCLDPEVLKIHGFSTPTMRHLFNNLCNIEGATYLEIGTFCGATFCAAFNNNPIHAIGIDDFSQPFEEKEVEKQLTENLERWKGTAKRVQFFNEPCFNMAGALLKNPVDIYFYDGEHSYDSQVRALTAFFDMMADRFIHIVDDTNWDDVSRGTADGLKALEPYVKVEQEWHLTGDVSRSDDKIWHNGVKIYLISKVKP